MPRGQKSQKKPEPYGTSETQDSRKRQPYDPKLAGKLIGMSERQLQNYHDRSRLEFGEYRNRADLSRFHGPFHMPAK